MGTVSLLTINTRGSWKLAHPVETKATAAPLQLALLQGPEHDVIPPHPPVHLRKLRLQLVMPAKNMQFSVNFIQVSLCFVEKSFRSDHQGHSRVFNLT